MIRVLLADDQQLVRTGFRVLLEASGRVEVVGEAGDGAQAVALAAALRPQVVLMDIRMPGTDGLAAAKTITSDPDLAEVRIIMLTTYEEDEQIFAALPWAPADTWSRTRPPRSCCMRSRSWRVGRRCWPRP